MISAAFAPGGYVPCRQAELRFWYQPAGGHPWLTVLLLLLLLLGGASLTSTECCGKGASRNTALGN